MLVMIRRPVVVVQGNAINRSRLATVVCVPLTSNLTWVGAPGNVLLGGLLLISNGIQGEYIARIFEEVKGRPLYVVREAQGFEGEHLAVPAAARVSEPPTVSR